MKILHIISSSEWGGAQRVCFDIVTNLNKEGFQIEVAAGPGEMLAKKLKENNIPFHLISSFSRKIFSPLSDLRTLISLFSLIKQGDYNIIHCHSTKAGFWGRIAAKFAGVPKIYFTVHGWGFYGQRGKWLEKPLVLLEKMAANCSTTIICVSEYDKKEGLKRKIAKEDKFLVIKNGVDWKVREGREIAREKLGITQEETVVGMVARLTYQKNPMLFLRVAQNITNVHFRTRFVLIGSGDLFGDCQNFMKQKNLENKILLLGEKDPEEIRELLLGFDIFVLTSRFEGLPLSIIEAMFAGLPIVASDVCGVGELVEQERNGFLVEPNGLTDFVSKIRYLIENSRERKKIGRENMNMARKDFSLAKVIQKYREIYLGR